MGGILTHATRTFLGRPELGSLTLTKANWILPSESSSIRSVSSPSATPTVSGLDGMRVGGE